VSHEDAELVRWAFEGARDLEETAQAYWHPDIEYVEDPRWPGASRYKGRDAVLGCFQAYTEALGRAEDFTITVERLFDAGERQVPFVRFQSRASTSGVPHEHLWGYVVEVRDGRIVYFRAYYEPHEALAAVGLRK
jgi:ketosteroid isomerase-like protein